MLLSSVFDRNSGTVTATDFWCSSPATCCPCCSALCVCYCSSVGAATVALFSLSLDKFLSCMV
ncbi:hypothetical protein BVRB_2g035060 [Beta vulgaris subsp. vulgaris]|nr:hypothetical protein BVRB_2g035060 [Beta vulgaris subsp. vulgaris]